MGRQSQFKQARRVVNKQKKQVIIEYVRNNRDVVLEASIGVMKTFNWTKRLKIALGIIIARKNKTA